MSVSRSHLVRLLLLIVAAGSGCRSDIASHSASRPSQDSTNRHPNVVLIVADDLGWRDVGFHGGQIDTPNIDQLAKHGIRLERFYTSPVCTPTRAALLSGRSPVHFGLLYHVLPPWSPLGLPGQELTIAESFQSAGYQTAMVGKWHLGHVKSEYHPNMQGFDSFFGSVIGGMDYYTHSSNMGHDLQRNGEALHEKGYLTTLQGDEASRYIRERDESRPFFLYLAFNAPHSPNMAPDALVDKYAGRIQNGGVRVHAAMVDALDQAIGTVLEALAEEHLVGNTIIFFMSDNGGDVTYGAKNEPLRDEKTSVFEGGIRVPAILSYPRRLPGGVASEQFMRDQDVFATLEAAAGLHPLRAPSESMNLIPVFEGAPVQEHEPLFFAVNRTEYRNKNYQKAVIEGGWKLIVIGNLRPQGFHVRQRLLFHVVKDPIERFDLARDHPARVAELESKLLAWEALHPEAGLTIDGNSVVPPGWVARDDYTEYLTDPEVLARHLERRAGE
jgi:arylsulfatase A-like enzyme